MNYQPANISDTLKSSGDCGNAMKFTGSSVVSANLTTSDKVRPCRVAGGTLVDRVVIKNPDLDSGTALQIKIGFSPIGRIRAGIRRRHGRCRCRRNHLAGCRNDRV